MVPSIGVRILACILMWIALSMLWRSGWYDAESLRNLLMGSIGAGAAVGLWLQRRWGAVLFLGFTVVSFSMWARSLGFHDLLDVLMVPSMAVIYGVVVWFAWSRTYTQKELAMSDRPGCPVEDDGAVPRSTS